MSNPEFEPDILKSIDKSGYSEKQSAKQIDTKGTVRQQIKQVNDLKGQQSGTITLVKTKKEPWEKDNKKKNAAQALNFH